MYPKVNNILSNSLGEKKKTPVCMCVYIHIQRERHSKRKNKCGKMLQLINLHSKNVCALYGYSSFHFYIGLKLCKTQIGGKVTIVS